MAKAKAKTTKKKVELSFEQQLANHGGGTVLEDMEKSKYFVDTGNLALNYCTSGRFMGGGLPSGKISEIYGPPASSKSLLAYSAAGSVLRKGGYSIILDCERAVNPDFAMSAGHCDPSRMVVVNPMCIEECELKVTNMVRFIRENKGDDVPIFIVWDSIGASPCRREIKETDLPENFTQAEFKSIVGANQQPGERARKSGDFLRKITPFLDENDATLLVINQVRSAIGIMYGPSEVTAGGGKALEFYASTRIRTSAAKAFHDSVKKLPIGVSLKFTNKKNRSFTPFLACENIPLYFKQGIEPLGGLLQSLIYADRVEKVSNGNYKVLPEFANGSEYKFKSSAARGTVDMEVLCECPKMIDAESSEEVMSYLEVFSSALGVADSPDVIESDMEDESQDLASKMSEGK